MARAKFDESSLRLPVFFFSFYWFLLAYALGSLVLFWRYSTDHSFGGYIKQLLFINITYDLQALLFAYFLMFVLASIFSLIVIYIREARVAALVGGSAVGICLGLFALVMTLYYSSQPCAVSGCGDVDYNIFVLQMIYFIYGNFIASLIPVAYALTKVPVSVGDFLKLAFKPGVIALAIYFGLGVFVVFSVR